MKIAFDKTPITPLSGHKVRGAGFYVKRLMEALLKYDQKNTYIFFTQGEPLPSDVDLVHYPYFEPFSPSFPKFSKVKAIVTVHDLIPFVFPSHFPVGVKGKFKWQIQKLALKKSSAIITDSLSSKKDIEKIAGISNNKIHSIPLAADEKFRAIVLNKVQIGKIQKKYNLPEEFVLYVGDVTWNKNVLNLVRAIKKTHYPLVIVGKAFNSEFDENNIWNESLVEVHKVIDNNSQFLVLGFVDDEDLMMLYNLASTFVFPSVYEGFGLPVLEAMQSGCPVVTTREGSLKEIVGDAAQIVNGYSVDSIAEGIKDVMENRKLQNVLAEKGMKHSAKYTWKATAEKTIQVYNSVYTS